MTASVASIRSAAHALIRAGISVVPVAPGVGKRPVGSWKKWQTVIPTAEQVDAMFANPALGLGVVTGVVSGNLEMLELEDAAMRHLDEITELAEASGLGDLWRRIQTGWVEQSPSGGVHWFYRVDGVVPGNTKLASDEDNHVLAETRGEGGFVVAAPTPGTFHTSGSPWVRMYGGAETVPIVTMSEREALHALFATLNRAPVRNVALHENSTPTPLSAPGDGVKPGDDFENKTDWTEILTPHGWVLVYRRGGERFWRRPDKTEGISASTGHAGDRDRLYVFTTSTVFRSETPYTKFGAYALLNHGGDHAAAARELARQGYGDRKANTPKPSMARAAPLASESRSRSRESAARKAAASHPVTFTDAGNATLIAENHADTLVYVADAGKWASWNATRWEWGPDDAAAIQAAWKTIDSLTGDSPEAWKHKIRSLSAASLGNAVKILRSIPDMRAQAKDFDAHHHQLNTPEGVVDLRDGTLRDTHPSLKHTKQTGCAYDPSIPTPKWDRFLHTTFAGDEAMISYVQRLAGISAIGDVTEHVLPFLYGSGQNGKTVFLETLQAVLGDYATEAPHGFLNAGRDKHETELANLQGRRLVVASEVNENTRFDEAKMKTLTGGDRITARLMRQDYFTFTPTHTLWLMGNNQPKVTTGGHSFWRRLRLIPFTHTVSEEEKIEGLQQQLVAEEGPGILAWIVSGAIDARQHGLGEPETVIAATAEYAAEEDHLARFLDERCYIGGGQVARIDQAELRRAYAAWCAEEGEDELTPQMFGRRIKARHGVETVRSNGRKCYANITLYTTDDDQTASHWSDR